MCWRAVTSYWQWCAGSITIITHRTVTSKFKPSNPMPTNIHLMLTTLIRLGGALATG